MAPRPIPASYLAFIMLLPHIATSRLLTRKCFHLALRFLLLRRNKIHFGPRGFVYHCNSCFLLRMPDSLCYNCTCYLNVGETCLGKLTACEGINKQLLGVRWLQTPRLRLAKCQMAAVSPQEKSITTMVKLLAMTSQDCLIKWHFL